jgi:hypothetical protein
MPASFDGQVGAIVLAMLGSTPKQPCSSGLGSSVSLSGARARLFGAIRAPSTLGSHLVRVNVLAVTVNTPLAAPVIAGTRMRGGNAASAPGATNFAARAVRAARARACGCGCGCGGTIMVRMDSAYYAAGLLHAVRRLPVRAGPRPRDSIAGYRHRARLRRLAHLPSGKFPAASPSSPA